MTPVSQETDSVIHNVNACKYLIGTIHQDIDYELDLVKMMDVVEESFDEEEGPIILAYRRRITASGKLLPPKTEDDEYSYQIQDIVQTAVEYAWDHPETLCT